MQTFTNKPAKATNLNPFFIDQVRNFAHLITAEPQTKEEFLNHVKRVYCTSNPKTALFCGSIERSEFETIQLNRTKDAILFNQ